MPRYLFVHHHKPHTESTRMDIRRTNSHFCFDRTTWIDTENNIINEDFCYDRHELSFGSFTVGTGLS